MIRYYTAGESHGKCVTAIIEGLPAGLEISEGYINEQLARRQKGYGRGKRMEIETDTVEFLSGVRWGQTLGSPVCLLIRNRDWENWETTMSSAVEDRDESLYITRARPGHADLSGALKYDREDVRDILERASARETAGRVAAGALARKLLEEFGISIYSFTVSVGAVEASLPDLPLKQIASLAEKSVLRCPDGKAEKDMIKEIDAASDSGDTLGGVFMVAAEGLPAGLGTHVQWKGKLDGRLAMALMSIQAIKGVEVGRGFEAAALRGSDVHDEIRYDEKKRRFFRLSNNAGGIEGGMTNGEPVVLRVAMKPISSLRKPLTTVDMKTKKEIDSEIIRSDVCAVPAAGVIGESVTALELADLLKEKTGGDSVREMKRNYSGYLKQLEEF